MFIEFMEDKKYRCTLYLKFSMRRLSTLYAETQEKLADTSIYLSPYTYFYFNGPGIVIS